MRESRVNDTGHNAVVAETTIVGKVMAASDIRIDGKVEGEITCKGKVIIGKSGIVIGTLHSNSVELLGRLEGNIVVDEQLSLKADSHFSGSIVARSLSIEPGAKLEGDCSIQMPNQDAK